MKLWPKDKSITWDQGYRVAWTVKQMTVVLLLTLGLRFFGLSSSQLSDVGTWSAPHCSDLRPVGWAGGFREAQEA